MNDAYLKKDSGIYSALAELAIENKIFTRQDLNRVIDDIRSENQQGRKLSFEDALLKHKIVDKETLLRLIAATIRSIDKKFADQAVKNGFIITDDASEALESQKELFKKGDLVSIVSILIKKQKITLEQRDTVLKQLSSTIPSFTSDISRRATAPYRTDPQEESLIKPDLEISRNHLRADVHIPEGLSSPIELEDIKALIEKHNLKFGVICDEDIKNHLKRIGFSSGSFVLAIGIPALPARDAVIRIFFVNNYLNPGKITDFGTIDFRNRGAVPFVKEGIVLAEKIPGVDGKPGTNIFGKIIPSEEAVDQPLKSGPGTVISDDGLKIIATIAGQPLMTVHGEVTVMKELIIPGDVDYTTGNIIFDGSIIVKGSINQGFIVKGGALTAKDANGAEIEVAGNIEISGGIMDSVLRAGGAVQAMHMSGTKIDAYGDVIVKKEVVDCKIRTSGAFNGETARVVSSLVSAKKGILARQIGTDVSRPCTIRAGISDHTEKKIRYYRSEVEKRKKELELEQKKKEEVQSIHKQLHKDVMDHVLIEDKLRRQKNTIESFMETLKSKKELSEKEKKQLDKLEAGHTFCITEIKRLEEQEDIRLKQQDSLTFEILDRQTLCEDLVNEIEGLHEKIREIRNWDKKSPPQVYVRILREIFAQTVLNSPNSMLILKDTCRNVTIREVRRSDSDNDWEIKIEHG